MTKGNIMEFAAYNHQRKEENNNKVSGVSEELENAIEQLILRLRESNPIQKSG